MSSETMQALRITAPDTLTLSTVPIPSPSRNTALVKVSYVALNPTDYKTLAAPPTSHPHTLGCDFFGTVAALGEGADQYVKIGDRVAMACNGRSVGGDEGSFAEYVVAKAGTLIKVPENVKGSEAAGLGVGVLTVGQAVYQNLGLSVPGEESNGEGKWVLVYGASSATGSLAVQFAKLSGWNVVATCSPHNNTFVSSLGADKIYDYRSPTCGADINSLTSNSLTHAFDCIGGSQAASITCAALSSSSSPTPLYASINMPVPDPFPRADVEIKKSLAYSAMSDMALAEGRSIPFSQKDHEFAIRFVRVAERALGEGKVRPHPVEVREGGLGKVSEGLKDMKEGKVSGVKIVYKVGDGE